MKIVRAWLGIVVCSLVVSCGMFDKKTAEEEKPFGETGIPKQLRANPEVDAAPGAGQGIAAAEISVALANHPSQENIVWTDPDNMDANIPELQKLLAAPKRDIWQKSESEAKRIAIREGKCVLIWFTDSVRSPVCKTLSEELFGKHEFGEWAKEHLVRLIVDQSALMARGEKYDSEVVTQEYVEQMKKRYKALGTPTVIMLSPKGEILAKYRGFKKGQGEFFWGQIKYSAGVGESEYQAWLQKLEKQGYRHWTDKQNRRVVARLVSYNKGTLVMVEPDGNRCRTDEGKLSDQDRDWIKAEKTKRGIE